MIPCRKKTRADFVRAKLIFFQVISKGKEKKKKFVFSFDDAGTEISSRSLQNFFTICFLGGKTKTFFNDSL